MTNSGKSEVNNIGPVGVKRPILARSQSKQASSSQTKVTEMLLVVSSVFICLNLPSYVIRVWVFVNEAIQTETVSEIVILQHYFNLLFNTNFGINFALYCVSGQNFRRALISLFCPRMRKRQDTTQVTGVTSLSNKRPSATDSSHTCMTEGPRRDSRTSSSSASSTYCQCSKLITGRRSRSTDNTGQTNNRVFIFQIGDSDDELERRV
ncbi:sex peptide receptor-related protein 2-like isoform X1 [Macrosteles quadrilineatus]|uniref:sex peptide receptor-related protein 2-like isoform X1 n=1 Tax=Macrosteles quadrilineatus TaxID=74068 RepID=UPI0023E30040|nr:sex peptide receptor-related protein 2-like isoform X1 [Macrosteles quadrilineatus]